MIYMHQRYMIYLDNKNKKRSSENYKHILLHIRSILSDISNIEVRDIRISSYFIEIDLSLYNSEQKLIPNTILSRLNSVSSLLYCDDLSEAKLDITKDSVINHAIFLFNIERFWKSHEALESIWKESLGIEKQILNGIILIDAAFVHYQKNEIDIFISILKRSLAKLQECRGMFYSLNLDEIKNNINNIINKNYFHTFKIYTY
jgi:uncharacterized protein